ncbi:hypothetical protein ECANGB1_704 [Enterospora canceri]|uniref:Uncharacterized protein n=1 Tax=Enterospora canceri TaxID=1081671 RepID=A0A1Y1S7M1_9MICR|nr:hypothetical protein ECANGB1_704 [Enterospora canceri]
MKKLGFKEILTTKCDDFIETDVTELIFNTHNTFVYKEWIYIAASSTKTYKIKNNNFKRAIYVNNLVKLDDSVYKISKEDSLVKTNEVIEETEGVLMLGEKRVEFDEKIKANRKAVCDNEMQGKKHIGVSFRIKDDEIMIITATDTDKFVYLLNSQVAECIDEEQQLALRLNAEFNEMQVKNIVFYNNRIFLVDDEMTSTFCIEVNDEEVQQKLVELKEIHFEGDSLCRLDETRGIFEKKALEDATTLLALDEEIDYKMLQNVADYKEPSEKEKKPESKITNTANTFGIQNTFSMFKDNLKSKSTTGLNKAENSEDKNKDKLNNELSGDIRKLQEKFNQKSLKNEFKEFRILESHFDINALYKRIFERSNSKYEELLSRMIVKVDEYNKIDCMKIEETIRHFDTVLFYKGKKPIKTATYNKPMIGRDVFIEKGNERMQNIIRGIKMIEIKTKAVVDEGKKVIEGKQMAEEEKKEKVVENKIVEKETKEVVEPKITPKAENMSFAATHPTQPQQPVQPFTIQSNTSSNPFGKPNQFGSESTTSMFNQLVKQNSNNSLFNNTNQAQDNKPSNNQPAESSTFSRFSQFKKF